jgi:hypothetical protein
MRQEIRGSTMHQLLQDDLVEHIWRFRGNTHENYRRIRPWGAQTAGDALILEEERITPREMKYTWYYLTEKRCIVALIFI